VFLSQILVRSNLRLDATIASDDGEINMRFAKSMIFLRLSDVILDLEG
jgi:hypothetical protein